MLRELEKFILEFGKGFAFIMRQKRMIIDGLDFHLDLLFYNRNLKRLVAVELKQGHLWQKYDGTGSVEFPFRRLVRNLVWLDVLYASSNFKVRNYCISQGPYGVITVLAHVGFMFY